LFFLPEIKYLLSPVLCFLPEIKYRYFISGKKNKIQEREDTLSQVKNKVQEREDTLTQVKNKVQQREDTFSQVKNKVQEREKILYLRPELKYLLSPVLCFFYLR
jgi:hypothetical protein